MKNKFKVLMVVMTAICLSETAIAFTWYSDKGTFSSKICDGNRFAMSGPIFDGQPSYTYARCKNFCVGKADALGFMEPVYFGGNIYNNAQYCYCVKQSEVSDGQCLSGSGWKYDRMVISPLPTN